jgi:predicted nucleic acid-binding protein
VRVIDAGVVVDLLMLVIDPAELGEEPLAAPHLIDSEVLHALRRRVAQGVLTETEGRRALDAFENLAFTRHAAAPLRSRIWELRHNLSAYDATYVALAEALGATSLLTTDARLARVPGLGCAIEVV